MITETVLIPFGRSAYTIAETIQEREADGWAVRSVVPVCWIDDQGDNGRIYRMADVLVTFESPVPPKPPQPVPLGGVVGRG